MAVSDPPPASGVAQARGPRRTRSLGGNTVLISIAQVAVLLAAALLGILIARSFGTTPATDGFFAANAIYGVTLLVAQSLRTTTAASLVAGGFPRFERNLRAVGWLAALNLSVSAIAVALAGVLGLEPEARASFQITLALLAGAATLQLFTGQAAAMLAALHDYASAALAYVAGSTVAVCAFVALHSELEVRAVPLGLVIGAATSSAVVAVSLVRRGWRPRIPARGSRNEFRLGLHMLLGSVAQVTGQVVIVISVAFAGTTGSGNTTLYSYAMMAVLLLTTALASPISIVFAPVVAREPDRSYDALSALNLRTFRAGALAVGPLVAGMVLVGPEPAHWALKSLSKAQVNQIFDLVLVLSPAVLATMLMTIPIVAVFASNRFAPLAVASAAVVLLDAAVSVVSISLGASLTVLAAIAMLSSLALAAVPLALVYGRRSTDIVARSGRAAAQFVLPAIAMYGAAALIVSYDRSLATGAVAWVAGSIVYAAWLAAVHRHEITELATALRAPS